MERFLSRQNAWFASIRTWVQITSTHIKASFSSAYPQTTVKGMYQCLSGKFYVNLTKLSQMRREISVGNTQACWAFLFVIHMGTFNLFNHPWAASLVFYKEACWARHEEQATKQQSSMNSASPSSSRFLPSLSSHLGFP